MAAEVPVLLGVAGEWAAPHDALDAYSARAGGPPVRHGFVAQDLHKVYPEAVVPGDTGTDVVAAWGVDNSNLVPLLLLELQALRARVAILEAA